MNLNEVKEKCTNASIATINLGNEYSLTQEVEWLIEQAEKAERYESVLKTIAKLTRCDDTWNFARRALEGKEKIELPYRFNQI